MRDYVIIIRLKTLINNCKQIFYKICIIFNPRRACAARVTVYCRSLRLSVYDYSRTTGYEAAHERYQQLQCYKTMKNNVAILLKRLPSEASEKPTCIMSTGLPRPGLPRSAHRGQIKLLRGYISKFSAALNLLTITQLASYSLLAEG